MAHADTTSVRDLLQAQLPDELVLVLAKLHEVVQRKRKVEIVPLVWVLILGWTAGARRSLSTLRRSYERHTGETLAASSFYERFTPQLAKMLRGLLEHLMGSASQDHDDHDLDHLHGFRKLLALDATIVRLWGLLSGRFPGTSEGSAGVKLHLMSNVVDATPNRLKLTSETRSEQVAWRGVGSWVKGCLLLFDLGYYSYWLFHRIDRRKGFFLTRCMQRRKSDPPNAERVIHFEDPLLG